MKHDLHDDDDDGTDYPPNPFPEESQKLVGIIRRLGHHDTRAHSAQQNEEAFIGFGKELDDFCLTLYHRANITFATAPDAQKRIAHAIRSTILTAMATCYIEILLDTQQLPTHAGEIAAEKAYSTLERNFTTATNYCQNLSTSDIELDVKNLLKNLLSKGNSREA